MLRLVLLFFLSILSAQAWSHVTPASLVYSYDEIEYLVVDRNFESEAQNQQYDGSSNFRYCCGESLSSDLQEKTQTGSFFAFIGDFIVTKGGDDFFKGTKFTDKVKRQMQQDDFHSFPRSVEGFQDAGKVTKFKGGDGLTREKLEIPGGFKGKEGKFEFIKESNGTINHRFFRPDGQ